MLLNAYVIIMLVRTFVLCDDHMYRIGDRFVPSQLAIEGAVPSESLLSPKSSLITTWGLQGAATGSCSIVAMWITS